MKKWRQTIALMLFGMAITSTATASDDDTKVVRTDLVETLIQAKNESKETFIRRAAVTMWRYTHETAFEASGHLCQDSHGRLGMMVLTWKAHFSSPAMRSCPLQTPNLEGRFMHSHPWPGSYQVTERDRDIINKDRWLFRVGEGQTIHIGPKSAHRFSSRDYEAGPGWLVTANLVYYQEGRGTQRLVMDLANPDRTIPVE